MDVLVLAVLAAAPLHGYGIARRIEELSHGALNIEEGTLYPALKRLARAGEISGEWVLGKNKRRRREYRLTESGRRKLAEQAALWRTFSGAVAKVLDFGGPAFRQDEWSIEITE